MKKSRFFETSQNYLKITRTFTKPSSINCPSQISESDFQALEQFVVIGPVQICYQRIRGQCYMQLHYQLCMHSLKQHTKLMISFSSH